MTRGFDVTTGCCGDTRDGLTARVLGGLGWARAKALAGPQPGNGSRKNASGRDLATHRSRCAGMTHGRVLSELTLAEVLSDPIVRSLMHADRVDPAELKTSLDLVADQLARRRQGGAL